MRKRDKYFLNIKQIHPDTQAVVKPMILGMVRDVFIAESPNGKYVCRFLDKPVAEHNLQISNILTQHNIPVPKVSIHNCGNYWCETYPFIPGKTLYERILEGISCQKLDDIYEQIINMSYKISDISCSNIVNIPVPLTSKFKRKTLAMLNPSQKKCLCHMDLHSKNIVLDENDNLRAIIDLDAFDFEPLTVSHLIILKDAYCHGYDIKRIKNTSVQNPEIQIKIFNDIAKIYEVAFPMFLRKQLLKIRVK